MSSNGIIYAAWKPALETVVWNSAQSVDGQNSCKIVFSPNEATDTVYTFFANVNWNARPEIEKSVARNFWHVEESLRSKRKTSNSFWNFFQSVRNFNAHWQNKCGEYRAEKRHYETEFRRVLPPWDYRHGLLGKNLASRQVNSIWKAFVALVDEDRRPKNIGAFVLSLYASLCLTLVRWANLSPSSQQVKSFKRSTRDLVRAHVIKTGIYPPTTAALFAKNEFGCVLFGELRSVSSRRRPLSGDSGGARLREPSERNYRAGISKSAAFAYLPNARGRVLYWGSVAAQRGRVRYACARKMGDCFPVDREHRPGPAKTSAIVM